MHVDCIKWLYKCNYTHHLEIIFNLLNSYISYLYSLH